MKLKKLEAIAAEISAVASNLFKGEGSKTVCPVCSEPATGWVRVTELEQVSLDHFQHEDGLGCFALRGTVQNDYLFRLYGGGRARGRLRFTVEKTEGE